MGHLKKKIYATKATNLHDLRRKNMDGCNFTTRDMLQNVIENVWDTFQHLIK